MAACERCWADAYLRTRMFGGFQSDHYRDLIAENEADHTTDKESDHESARCDSGWCMT